MRWHAWLAVACVLAGAAITTAQDKSPLPTGAVARLGASRLRVPNMIHDSAFSLDQRTFVLVFHATEGTPPNVILFDVATGLERKRLDVHEARRIAMARQKPLMAVFTEQRTELWDLPDHDDPPSEGAGVPSGHRGCFVGLHYKPCEDSIQKIPRQRVVGPERRRRLRPVLPDWSAPAGANRIAAVL